ncbi:MAG: hypothetical protein IKA26_02410 [Alistipes sp.]|nr:hypothetical protein [Alistipes sp.]
MIRLFLRQSKSPMRSILLQKAELSEGILYQSKNAFKEVVATLSKKNEMGAYPKYVTISFFEDKEANAP